MNERQVRAEYDRICRRAFSGGLPLRRDPRPRPRWRVNWLVVLVATVLGIAALLWLTSGPGIRFILRVSPDGLGIAALLWLMSGGVL